MNHYRRVPLIAKIVVAALIGAWVGMGFGVEAAALHWISDLVLQLLRLLATPLIFLSLVRSILKTEIKGRDSGRLVWIFASNAGAAVLIGLAMVGILRPGSHTDLYVPVDSGPPESSTLGRDLFGRIPTDWFSPFSTNNVFGVILIGIAVAIALKSLRSSEHADRVDAIGGYLDLGLAVVVRMLHWTFELVPFAVLAVIAQIVGVSGVASLAGLGWFVMTVVAGLLVLFAFYLLRLRFSSNVRPGRFLRAGADAFAVAFSTASSMATLPVAYACATEDLGVGEESASLGVMLGGTLSHDGGALYQVVSALIVVQSLGHSLPAGAVLTILLVSFIASFCTAGIPQGGMVTMMAVFGAVHLPQAYIALLLPVDWFLDRCRTAINVAGDLTATCVFDRRDNKGGSEGRRITQDHEPS
jgi:DAACS family dicarboxylate/amino acid:cation (Na+ or H+) symporter